MINYIDKMADALVDVLKYSASDVEWIEPDDMKPNDGVEAEWFYPAVESEPFSEITAILQYTQQQALYNDEIGELMLGIALVEMKHYAVVRDIIVQLGGTLPRPFSGNKIEIGSTVKEALENAIDAEMKTIDYYKSVQKKITAHTESARIAHKILDKLIADEVLHLKLLNEELGHQFGKAALDKLSHLADKIKSYLE